MESDPAAPQPTRVLQRRADRRVLGGVAAGLSDYLKVPVGYLRIGFVLLSLLMGAGIVLYLFLVFSVPVVGTGPAPTPLSRLESRLRNPETRQATLLAVIAGGFVLAAVIALANSSALRGQLTNQTWLLPVVIMVIGVLLSWWQLSSSANGLGTARAGRPALRSLLRVGAGVLIAAGGAFVLVLQGLTLPDMARAALAAFAVLLGAAVVVAPWWLRLWNELVRSREEQTRQAQREEMAAHLHDSVLQTLAMIRTNSADAQRVSQLARAQERELRQWLYQGSSAPEVSLAEQLRAAAAELEDTMRTSTGAAVVIDLVFVGDLQPDEPAAALVQAAREAMLNAIKHGAPPISVYLEVGSSAVEVFITDRGTGFDPGQIPDDRFGVRHSIIGRMTRVGGSAQLRKLPTGGTEVHLQLPTNAEPLG